MPVDRPVDQGPWTRQGLHLRSPHAMLAMMGLFLVPWIGGDAGATSPVTRRICADGLAPAWNAFGGRSRVWPTRGGARTGSRG